MIRGSDGDDDKVLIRSDGTLTYIAKDMPYAAWKLGLFSDPFLYYAFSEQWDTSILWADTLDKSVGSPPKRQFGGAADYNQLNRLKTIEIASHHLRYPLGHCVIMTENGIYI